ncbi:ACP S-malonyltransferase [Nocardia sp. CA-107356]|uniref:ACP S-malonyltransferase n=1 Tax=Nocardia sp. CA-107356 TaxID=3239972 RepID=UPI003D90D197
MTAEPTLANIGFDSAAGICFLFPGQGAYLEEIFLDLAGDWPQVGRTFDDIDCELTSSGAEAISPILFSGSPPSLKQLLSDDPDTLQLVLFGTAVAVYRILCSQGINPAVLAGHSLGEVAALVAAGVFTTGEGARIVHLRSQCLNGSADAGGMLAVRGTARRSQALVDLLAADGLVVAVENGPHQTVLAGPGEALSRAEKIAREAELPSLRIASAYPFHSPLLAGPAVEFRHRLDAVTSGRRPLRTAVYSPILARFYTDDDDFAEVLSSHLVRPVRFCAALRYLHESGAKVFVECGARDALVGIVRKTLPAAIAVPTVIRGRSGALLLPQPPGR